MFLDGHDRGYNLLLNENLLSLVTGFSGIPYAMRHWDLSQDWSTGKMNPGDLKYVWGNRIIAVLEFIPIIGGLAALIEKITFLVKEKFFSSQEKPSWIPGKLDTDTAHPKMLKNSRKAIIEHKQKDPAAYVSVGMSLSLEASPSPLTLTFQYFKAEAQGEKNTMEDTHFFKETDQGIFTGVLDGHRGKEVADYASIRFKEEFFEMFNQENKNIHRTFELLIDKIQKDLKKMDPNIPETDKNIPKRDWSSIGTTAVLCFIDKSTHQIYTATLGDSEANIYRKIDQQMKSIPLSCVRDWGCTKEAKRASIALRKPNIAITWPKNMNPKELSSDNCRDPSGGPNVSRAIGNVNFQTIIHKPKITVNQLSSGDTLVLACDGLKDFVNESKIISKLETMPADPATELVNFAIKDNKSTDNVTAIVIRVGDGKEEDTSKVLSENRE
jgi:serine/threonine protein phosphatase PrpC